MKVISRLVRTFVIVAACGLFAACDFTVTDEERLSRAEAHMAAADYQSALIELKNVLSGSPDNLEARLQLAEVSLALGDVMAADRELAHAVEIGAPEDRIRLLHLDILTAQNRHVDVLAALGMETGGLTEIQQLSYRARALLATGNAAAAKETYESWLELEPKATDARIGLAKSLATLGEIDMAVEITNSVIEYDASSVDAWLTLGSIRFGQGDHGAAITALTEALAQIGSVRDVRRRTEILSYLAEAQLLTGELEDARRNIERLNGLVPRSPAALLLSARLAQTEQDYALAARHLQTLLSIQPNLTRAQVFLADMQIRQGYVVQAEALLERVISRAPDNLHARRLLAGIQLRRADPDKAMDILAPVLDAGSADPEIYSLAAQVSFEQGNVEVALETLRVASASAPNDLNAQLNLAVGYLLSSQIDPAIALLEELPAGHDGFFAKERLLAAAYRRQGRADEADSIVRNVVLENDDDPGAYAFAGRYFLDYGNLELAQDILLDAHRQYPQDVAVILALATLELRNGRPAQSNAYFQEVLHIDDRNLPALMGLARGASAEGDHDRMQSYLEDAAGKHPLAVEPRVYLASHYMADGQDDAALRLARESIRLGVRNPRFNAMIGDLFSGAGLLDEALLQYELAAERLPGNSAVLMSLARAYLALDRSRDARATLNRVLESDSNNPSARAVLALVDLRLGNLSAASQSIEMLQRLHPDDPAGMILQGELLFEQGEFVAAAEAFRRAAEHGGGRRAVLREHVALVNARATGAAQPLIQWLARNPDDVGYRLRLAQHYQINEFGALAIEEYERALEFDPDNVTALNNLAWQYQRDGQLEQAADLAERAWRIDDQSASVADTLAWTYYQQGRLGESERLLRRAVSLSPDNGEIRFHLAVLLARSGREEEARSALEQLLRSDIQFPSRNDAEELLQEM